MRVGGVGGWDRMVEDKGHREWKRMERMDMEVTANFFIVSYRN